MHKIIKRLTMYGLMAFCGLFLLSPAPAGALTPVVASSQSNICEGIGATNANGTCTTSTASLNSVVKLVINILSLIAGIAAVIMIIVAGIRYITSGGDGGKVSGAKNALIYAIIGLVVVALAQIVVRFVLKKV